MASVVWEFFKVTEEDSSLVTCNKCSKRVPRGGRTSTSYNTSNMISHLKHNHRFDGVLKAYEDARAARNTSASKIKPPAKKPPGLRDNSGLNPSRTLSRESFRPAARSLGRAPARSCLFRPCSTSRWSLAQPRGPERGDRGGGRRGGPGRSGMCSVIGCDSWRRGVERFGLPEDPERRLEWVQFVLEVNGQRLNESSWTEVSICGEHFTDDCLDSPAAGEPRLRSGAVPSQMEASTEKWTDGEVRALLHLFGRREVQRDGARRNMKLYASISEQLAARGVHRTAKQCREKIKKLKQDYKKVKDHNVRSGYDRKTNKWYEKMDAILGHRPEYAGSQAADGPLGTPQGGGRGSVTDTVKSGETPPDGSDEGFLNEEPSAGMSSDCSSPSSPCPPSTSASPPCLSNGSAKPSTSYTRQPRSPLPRPVRKRKREDSGLQRLVKQLLQKDEEDRRTSQRTMDQLLEMLRERNARDAEERERRRAEAAEERCRQDAFYKLLSMLLLRLTEATQRPTHPTLD